MSMLETWTKGSFDSDPSLLMSTVQKKGIFVAEEEEESEEEERGKWSRRRKRRMKQTRSKDIRGKGRGRCMLAVEKKRVYIIWLAE